MVFGQTRAVKSHRTGRRRKKGGSRLPVAPWIVISLVCVLVASALTVGFVMLMRSGCGGSTYRVSVAVASNIGSTMEDLASEWERGGPRFEGQCVGVEINPVSAVDASRGLTGEWNTVSLGPRPIAWLPDSDVWPQWVAGTEVTADYFSSAPVVLGQSRTVLAVPEPVAQELGWLGGAPPSWSAVLDAVESGEVVLAAANPRTSTEGLQSMLNAVSDGAGGVDAEAMRRYSAALDAGPVAEGAQVLFGEYREAEDPGAYATAFTALDYQVADFNESSEFDFELVPITPSGSELNAIYPYLVLDGAGWVSGADASIATMFGDFLQTAGAREQFGAAGIAPVEEGSASATITGEMVRDAVRQWQGLRRDLNVLLVVDRSDAGAELVDWGGESVSAADAAVRAAVGVVERLGSTSRAGLWEYGPFAGGDEHWRSVREPAEMSGEGRGALEEALWSLSEGALYSGGSPLFDTVTAAFDYLADHQVEGAENVVLVFTNGGVDTVSAPTVEQTAAALAEAKSASPAVSVYTVGFGEAHAENLGLLAEATGGVHLSASSGDVLGALRERLVN